ncbi:MAG: hypothetical protein IT581_20995 [Verrucomicrobiales bacterium]|nr:hypothetical protein [Verrucomicrobiales bacterium]
MRTTLHVRLGWFILVLAAAVSTMAWAAYTSWSSGQRLSDRLDEVDKESFHLAELFQQRLLELNDDLPRTQSPDAEPRRLNFENASRALDEWLSEQRPKLRSEEELAVLQRLDSALDGYLAAARQLLNRAQGVGGGVGDSAALVVVDHELSRLLGLGLELAAAHRAARGTLVQESRDSLRQLRNLLLGSLGALVLAGTTLAVVVYREMIQPLQTRLVEAQAQAERHEKLAALGVLGAGVAHELRNPLTAIKARVYTLQKRLADGSAEKLAADVIDAEIGRLERIVRDFLQFARPSDPEFVNVTVRDELNACAGLLAPQLQRAGVELTVDAEISASILADPQQLRQVLINLVQNGAQACSAGGRVRLEARESVARWEGREQPAVVIDVADNGCGITPEVQRKLFDPFFTTKPTGTGLGLPIAARIVEKHGGRIQFRTQPGRGSVFSVMLPRAVGR